MNSDTPALLCRRARQSDLPGLLALIADDVLGKNRDHGDPDQACYVQAFHAIDQDANQLLLVAELQGQEGEVIAMLQLTFIPGLSRRGAWRALIESVRVSSALRGQGIGRWLMQQAITQARERGCRLVQLTSDKQRQEAHRFYGSLGFVASHDGFKLALS
ncbi:GNAT family N-acetyltransferase [Undibacterium crateris]|uniref:GNAT family N-acetyltransferase n=1 Tax=Undibacterium crateris TaxID=2528175 RepID=UPI001389ED38|nr:GNAT family N-acetyltransferase [Undibacterium crateris]NDI87535.1 GNAT family N-acetyltransferase [Undibacterium crateris]